jgi:type II secretory pathway pseudopilin PulG
MMPRRQSESSVVASGDEGYMLLAVIVLVFMVLLTLSIAAPRIATQLKRDRELETQHRAQQYVRAIRLYYRKFKSYPSSIDQLEKSNNQRFLRQRYLDPMTGKDDWRLIKVGENKTKVKGFFGEDLPGIGGGLGAAAGLQSPGFAAPANPSSYSPGQVLPPGVASPGATPLQANPSGGTAGTGSTGSTSGTFGTGGSDGTSSPGGGGQIMGVGVPATGDSILTVNEQSQYDQWEFLYDPRIEQQYQKGALQGATGATAGSGLGNGQAPTGFPGTTTTPTTPAIPPTQTPTSPSTPQ